MDETLDTQERKTLTIEDSTKREGDEHTMPEKFHRTHEDHNQGRAVATGFHNDTTELEVEHLLNETMSTEISR